MRRDLLTGLEGDRNDKKSGAIKKPPEAPFPQNFADLREVARNTFWCRK